MLEPTYCRDSGSNPSHASVVSTDLAIVKRNKTQEEGRLKNIFKRTYLTRWISNVQEEANTDTKEHSVNLARYPLFCYFNCPKYQMLFSLYYIFGMGTG